ncbi:MAG: AraC family transcriptional regulator [Clostridia bacterium]|nr:AraC family transcriptional regulator [Clostridia bacterium]
MEYFNNIKIRKAIEHLKEGFSVKETAIALGFSDPNYFSTVFKRITGNPPSFYKK